MENRLIRGDSLRVLPTLPADSIDLIVTDPPYGLAFLGKDWDKALPPKEIWVECLRVLKPGAFAFVMCSPRQDCLARMVVNLQDAGFEMGFTSLYWTYACLSADTEVLTSVGWRNWEQLHKSKKNDKILVYDRKKSIFGFESPSAWQSYLLQEDLFRIKSEETDQLVSRNHKVFTKQGLILAENLKEQEEVVFLPSLPPDIFSFSSRNKKEATRSRDFLFKELQGQSNYLESDKKWQTQTLSNGGKKAKSSGIYAWAKKPRLERWSNLLQNTWKLYWRKVCSLPQRVFSYGSQGWVCYGAPTSSSSTIRQAPFESRSCPSYRPQPHKQQIRQFGALPKQSTAQNGREWKPYQTTLATVRREYYKGIVYCPTVSTGCFVARHNGKIFITGNSGFPKAGNIGKKVDKKRVGDKFWELRQYLRNCIEKSGLTQQQIKSHLGYPKNSGVIGHWIGKSQPNTPSGKDWEKLKTILPMDGRYDDFILEVERKVIGEKKAGLGTGDSFVWSSGNNSNAPKTVPLTTPATPQAQALDGSYAGFQPKPAVEVILVAMKPLSEQTYVGQALANRKGITWLDDGRIPYVNQEDMTNSDRPQSFGKIYKTNTYGSGQCNLLHNPSGRFPANLLVSDDVLNDGHNTKDGGIGGRGKHDRGEGYGFKATGEKDEKKPEGQGSFSRYFSLDAWWEEKVKELPESVQKIFPFLRVPKASKSEKGFDKAVIIDIIKIWKENNIIHEAKLAQLQVITGTLPLKVTAESGTKPSAVLEWSMSWFGSNLTAKYQRDFASIISMGTGLITALQIYNWLAFLFTSEYMGDVSLQMATGGSLAENVRDSKQLVISISERMASRLGVSPVVSGMQLKISVGAKLLGHPTVKPLALMSYLITLGSRPGDVVLDPFMGSGTTCLATKILGRKAIGIEKEKAYFDIAVGRCKNVKMD